MSDLKKAAEMALEALETDQKQLHWKIVRALRKALAQEQEAFTLDRGCWERGCVAYDERDGDGVTVYVAPVNMSQERVDETAKGEQEPVEKNMTLACPSYLHGYTTPPKREWVGLTDDEVESWRGNYDFFNSALVREVEVKLKEKNA